jgi:hypothetical protein
MCYNKEKKKEKINMKKKIKEMIKQFKEEKTFLENAIHWKVNELKFYDYYNNIVEKQKTINYLDMTWEQYDELNRKIKELKRDLKGTK